MSLKSNRREPSTSTLPGYQRTMAKFGLSAIAALCAETATFPLDLTKTRLQIQGEVTKAPMDHGTSAAASMRHVGGSSGNQLHTSSSTRRRGMLTMATSIVREEGPHKLWQGVQPALCRHLVYTGTRMGMYEVIRDHGLGKSADGRFPVWKAILSGLVAGSVGQFIASPMDLIKVQMQMEGRRKLEGHKPRVRGVGHALVTIYKQGGLRGLWKGWVPNVQRAALVNMGDLTTYDSVKHYILRNTSLKDNYVTHFLSSLCSGMVAAIVSTPADVVKTRIMNQPTDDRGRGLYYRSAYGCLAKTVKDEGFFALYKGFVPLYMRMAPWSLVFWLSYEKIRAITGMESF